jgi:putative Mg2+ transporter-C (MgtC) family protein
MEGVLPELVRYAVPVFVSALVGGLIGIEREYRDKSAGFRTMILIAVGSCLFTLLSVVLGEPDQESSRIAAAVVSGVGFLGAGVVLKEGITVHGLTTAAAIWLVASLGMAAGMGEYVLVGIVTILSVFVLWLFPPFERWLDRLHEFLEVRVTIKNSDKVEAKILELFAESAVKVVYVRRSRLAKGERTLYIKAKMTPQKRANLSQMLASERSIITFDA